MNARASVVIAVLLATLTQAGIALAGDTRAYVDAHVDCEPKKKQLVCTMNVGAWKFKNYNLAKGKTVGWVKFRHQVMAWIVDQRTLALLDDAEAKGLVFVAYVKETKEDKFGNKVGTKQRRVAKLRISQRSLSKVNFSKASLKQSGGVLHEDLRFVKWCRGFVKGSFSKKYF